MPFSLNGCGTRYYGYRDLQDDGSYTTTEWVIFIYIPLVPLASFRVLPEGDYKNYIVVRSQRYRVRKISLCWQQVRNTYLVVMSIPIAIFIFFFLASFNNAIGFTFLGFLISFLVFRKQYMSWFKKVFKK
jgi:hypothetical protein